MANRTAVKASGGKVSNAPLVTLKLSPQMSTTASMPRSASTGGAGRSGGGACGEGGHGPN